MERLLVAMVMVGLMVGPALAKDLYINSPEYQQDQQNYQNRLRSEDQGREDAMMGFPGSGPSAGGSQTYYDSGYREQQLRQKQYDPPGRLPGYGQDE